MLAKPNVSECMDKVGNRYEVALAVAKRARQISEKRIVAGDTSIDDAVNEASIEISEGKVKVDKE